MPEYRIPSISSLPAPEDAVRRRIVFVTNPNSRSLEYFGPLQVFDEVRIFLEHAGRTDLAYQIEFVSTESGPLYQRRGFSIEAPISYDQLKGPVDTLILQASDEDGRCLLDQQFLAWVRKMTARVRRMVSICTGSFILAEAGLLNGRRATTHWCAFDDFRARYPEVTLDPDAIYVKDDQIYTSAGATSGMDLAVALVEEDFGAEFARRVAQGLVMFLRRPAYQSQFSVHITSELPEDDRMREVASYIEGHLGEDLRIDTLATRFHFSPRTFIRTFTHTLGMPPGRYVEQCRIDRARQLLEETDKPLSKISAACGYSSTDGLRAAFERHLGTSPRNYRDRFASAVSVNDRSRQEHRP